MNDLIDNVTRQAVRLTRNSTFQAAIDICKAVGEGGGCAYCCAKQLERFCIELEAKDLAQEVLERAGARP
jgi:ATP-dependent protease HslVU (ClpYQ) peptidase subunit